MVQKPSILIVDDDPDIGNLLCAVAEPIGFSCTAHTRACEFLDELDTNATIVIIDIQMPGIDGIELLRMLARRRCKSDIVLISGLGKRILEAAEELARTLHLSHIGSLRKPFRIEDLRVMLLKHRRRMEPAILPRRRPLAIKDSELREALDREQLVVHYQPQITSLQGRLWPLRPWSGGGIPGTAN